MVRYIDLISDTICSPITATGYAGVGVIRISGENAKRWTSQHVSQKINSLETHQCLLSSFKNRSGHIVDQVLVTFFEKGKSFTGDETIEISCHGNPLIINEIIKTYLQDGARSAEKGEFSFRAFYNGKIDLVQAESIHQLVTTNTNVGSQTFLKHLEGGLSKEFAFLEEEMILALSHLEASIDFSEEDIETNDFLEVSKGIEKIKEKLNFLMETYSTGKALQDSFKILLLGETNVGKSSLFNAILNKERAIVTEVAGTTRDIITEQKFIGNSSVQLIDSAGLRSTKDHVEAIGIERSYLALEEADLVLYILDATSPIQKPLVDLPKNKTLLIVNKMDLVEKKMDTEKQWVGPLNKAWDQPWESEIFHFVSAKSNFGLTELVGTIEKRLTKNIAHQEGGMVTQARHYRHLEKLFEHIEIAEELLNKNESPDLISQELQLGLSEIHQILGKEYNDEILDKIFGEFCIGK